ncbi:MAG TPA: exo-beta-N-acetylmuramidase NamZ domain-containing protein, partial [Gemmataceae bacterium]
GHAGLFSTASDLAKYANMLLNEGRHAGKQILAPATVRLMTEPRPVPRGWRTYGWDVDTGYSANRGELFPRGTSFGHTGFTGTSVWIDPASETAVIFLSSRLHPDGKGNVTRLRGQVSTLAAAALSPGGGREQRVVLTGIDVLAREDFARLKGRKVGLVTNHTGRDREGRSTIDLLHAAEGVELVALFSPEHGIRGELDEKVGDGKDAKTGLPIWSLYGERRKPAPEQLKGIDTLVYDIQDAGCRFYTYISTLGLVMEAAAEQGLKVVVLDRPNPINGVDVAGPVLDAGRESFVGFHRLPVRHGMTVGELAMMFNAERKTKSGEPIRCDLEVVRMEGWRRGDFYDQTGLLWLNPSPNLRNLTAAYLYPGVGLLETTNLSVGRGTDQPFEWFGAPWLDGVKLAAALNAQGLPGVRFLPLRRTPASSVFKGETCGGVQISIDDWGQFEPLRTGLMIACELRRLYPEQWKVDRYDRLLADADTLKGLKAGRTWARLEQGWQKELNEFKQRRKEFLLYPE